MEIPDGLIREELIKESTKGLKSRCCTWDVTVIDGSDNISYYACGRCNRPTDPVVTNRKGNPMNLLDDYYG